MIFREANLRNSASEADRGQLTQVGLALAQLGVEHIGAYSPISRPFCVMSGLVLGSAARASPAPVFDAFAAGVAAGSARSRRRTLMRR